MAYIFGRLGGLIDVSFSEHERANTRRDRLVVGFRTSATITEPEVATTSCRLLARVVSATTNDFVELSLVILSPSLHPIYHYQYHYHYYYRATLC